MFNPYPYPNYQQPNYGGFQNPYGQPQYPNQPQQAQKPYFDFVNGIEGAKSYRLNPGQTAFLMDNDNAVLYVKTANAMGQSSIEYYSISKITEDAVRGEKAAQTGYVSRDDFDALAKKVTLLERSMNSKPEESANV